MKRPKDPKMDAFLKEMSWMMPLGLVGFAALIWLTPKTNISASKQIEDKIQSGLATVGVTRDLSKPSSRLVGHYRGSTIEYYLSPVNSGTGLGSFAASYNGKIEWMQYRVDSEDLNSDSVTISAGRDVLVPVTYWISKDGQTLKSDSHQMTYVDSATKP